MTSPMSPVTGVRATPVDRDGLVARLRLTATSLGYALAMAPALLFGILTILAIPLALVTAGFAIAWAAVPGTALLTRAHRSVSGQLLNERIIPGYADTTGTNFVTRPVRWLTDKARWRDFAFCWFSATGGFVLSILPVAFLATPFTHLILAPILGGALWWILAFVGVPLLVVWWLVTPALVRARAVVERNILGDRVEALEQRVAEVEVARSETLDHNASEVRRIERDLHDGAQARIAAVGMNVGLAEKLIATDPDAAAELLREARESTVSALDDLRSVVRGIHPPVLADRGLDGAIEALALSIPMPVTLSFAGTGRLPEPVESAIYFAVTECLANTVKHAEASRAYVTGTHDGTRLTVVAGDDGHGGADPDGAGLNGIRRRLAAFDGTLEVDSPAGGPTTITMEVPCQTAQTTSSADL